MNKGDIVQVVDEGRMFTTYRGAAERIGCMSYFNYGSSVPEGITGEVLGSTPHSCGSGEIVVGVRCFHDGLPHDILIGERGLSLLKRKRKRILERQEGETP